MKTTLFFLIPILYAASFAAEAPGTRRHPRPDDFRILNGKLFDITRSTNWVEFPRFAGSYEVVEKLTWGLLLQRTWTVQTNIPTGPTPSVALIKLEKRYGNKYVIKNSPAQASAKIGDPFEDRIHAFRIGRFRLKDEMVEVYDLGLPNIPENLKRP